MSVPDGMIGRRPVVDARKLKFVLRALAHSGDPGLRSLRVNA